MSSAGRSSGSSSPSNDLSSASYDGSHLPWRTFRQEVLTPHRILVLDTPPKGRIPATFLDIVEAASKDVSRFDDQKTSFWNQVTEGRGFGPSPLFPPNLLPPIESEPRLSRCMVPSFSREALPDRVISQMGPLYELSLPHPGLGCGFAASAFTDKELACMPHWLQATGTVVHFDTGYISPGAILYCPFLTFERAYGNKEHRVESANNQCAIGGAFSARALQMLYIRAWKGQMMPELPVSFSCTIDNSFALLNLHWIDTNQTYCMAPLCQFDLSRDEHFSKFLIWTQAIGDWALSHVLPLVKKSLDLIQMSTVIIHPPVASQDRGRLHTPVLKLDTTMSKSELLISSLKTTFENIPWRFDDDEFTPVSSSTASWGSPMVTDQTFSNLSYPTVLPPRSNSKAASNGLSAGGIVARKRLRAFDRSPVACHLAPPQPASQNQDIVWQKRLDHAMDEIRDLQAQIGTLKGALEVVHTSLRRSSPSPPPSEPRTPKVMPAKVQIEAMSALTLSPPMDWPRAGEGVDEGCDIDGSCAPLAVPSHPPAPAPAPATAPASSASTAMSASTPGTLWNCSALLISGHILASFIPNLTLRMMVIGCVTNTYLFASVWSKSLNSFSFSKLGLMSYGSSGWMQIPRTQIPLFAFWKKQR